jgi:hypothetical protein
MNEPPSSGSAKRIWATRNVVCTLAHTGTDFKTGARVRSLQMKISGPEQSEQPNDDQIDGDDIVQQPRHDKDQYAGEK